MKKIQLKTIIFTTILTVIFLIISVGLGIGIGLGVDWSNKKETTTTITSEYSSEILLVNFLLYSNQVEH